MTRPLRPQAGLEGTALSDLFRGVSGLQFSVTSVLSVLAPQREVCWENGNLSTTLDVKGDSQLTLATTHSTDSLGVGLGLMLFLGSTSPCTCAASDAAAESSTSRPLKEPLVLRGCPVQ